MAASSPVGTGVRPELEADANGGTTTTSSDPFESVPAEALRDAARSVVAAWTRDGDEALDDPDIREQLVAVARAVAEALPAGGPPDAPGAVTGHDDVTPTQRVVRLRLLDLLRAALVERWSTAAAAPDGAEMLEQLVAVESVRNRLEFAHDDAFTTSLLRADALNLVVEVAHDLRSPLTSILFLADPLRRGQSGEVNEVQRRQLGIIYSAALGLLTIASDVIELAQGGDRLSDHEPVPFSVADMLQSVRDMVQPVAEEKDLKLRLLAVEPDHRTGYSVALSRVMLNLTTNALKFTESGFVEIVARNTSPTRVEFSVRDTGDGIDPDILQELYRPFRRAYRRSGYHFSGAGLGLSISKKLVEVMESELMVETAKGWGTRFYFELDLPPCSLGNQ